MSSRKHTTASGAAAASGAAGNNDDNNVYKRVIEKLNERTAQGAPENNTIDQAMVMISNYQRAINDFKGRMESETLAVGDATLAGSQDNIHAGEKKIQSIKRVIKHLQSMQNAEEYKIDIEILNETGNADEQELKELREKLEKLNENNEKRQANYDNGSVMHPTSKLDRFKNDSEVILKKLHLDFDKDYNAAIENLANNIEDLIFPLWVYGQMQGYHEGTIEEARELVDVYMVSARAILDGFNDRDMESNPSIKLLKEQYNIDLKKMRSLIEKQLQQRAEQYYGLNAGANNRSGGAAAGARQRHPEGGPSEGGGRRKKTRRSRHKKQVTAKYRK